MAGGLRGWSARTRRSGMYFRIALGSVGQHSDGSGVRQTLVLLLIPHSCVTQLEKFLKLSVSLSLLICKMGMTVSPSRGHCEDEVIDTYSAHQVVARFLCLHYATSK